MDKLGHLNEVFDPNVAVLAATAIIRDAKILLVREEAEPYNRRWVLPQGYVKNNETLSDAARREVREELGVEVDILNLVGIYEDFKQEEGQPILHYVIVCFLARISDREEVKATSEVIDSLWIDPDSNRSGSPMIIQRMLRDVSKVAKKRKFLPRYRFGT